MISIIHRLVNTSVGCGWVVLRSLYDFHVSDEHWMDEPADGQRVDKQVRCNCYPVDIVICNIGEITIVVLTSKPNLIKLQA